MRIKAYIILLTLLSLTTSAYTQVSEYEYKAAFIERFTRFVEWPNEFKDNTFKLIIIGDNPFMTSLDALFENTKIKGQKVELIYTDKSEDLTQANVVFIASSERKQIEELLSTLSGKPILIISDSKGFGEMGVHINMYIDDNYIKYEINQKAIEKSGLKVSSLLFASAKIVETDD